MGVGGWRAIISGLFLLSHSGNFEEGVPYRITVTAVSPAGLSPAPSVWVFTKELGKKWVGEGGCPGILVDLN
jgi:hypothetical protein